jgi:two-component system chemotaxis response regulator CheY
MSQLWLIRNLPGISVTGSDSVKSPTRLMRTILIVDDSPTIRRMVKVALADVSEHGFTEAASGLEAIEQLTLAPPALIVLDLNMPDMHGIEVLTFLRRHPSYKALPVIVLTTRGDASSREAALRAGATMYVTKPFVPSVLANHVREALNPRGQGEKMESRRVEP